MPSHVAAHFRIVECIGAAEVTARLIGSGRVLKRHHRNRGSTARRRTEGKRLSTIGRGDASNATSRRRSESLLSHQGYVGQPLQSHRRAAMWPDLRTTCQMFAALTLGLQVSSKDAFIFYCEGGL
jgi:hypothetical protein